MHNRVNKKVNRIDKQVNAQWESAILELTRQLTEAKARVAALKKAIRTWTRLRDEGLPWPEKS